MFPLQKYPFYVLFLHGTFQCLRGTESRDNYQQHFREIICISVVFGAGGMAVVKGWKGKRERTFPCKIKVLNSWAGFVRMGIPQGVLDNPSTPKIPWKCAKQHPALREAVGFIKCNLIVSEGDIALPVTLLLCSPVPPGLGSTGMLQVWQKEPPEPAQHRMSLCRHFETSAPAFPKAPAPSTGSTTAPASSGNAQTPKKHKKKKKRGGKNKN